MREDESNWFAKWEKELPLPDELMPLSQTLITPDLALAFDIGNNTSPNATTNTNTNITAAAATAITTNHHQPPPPPPPPPPAAATHTPSTPPPTTPRASSQSQQQPNSAEFAADSAELGSGGAGDEPARTLKRPRLVWTPQLHKRFVDAVAHLGIKNAVPKTIMQLMSVDGLTRENVASHLQKYRLYLKRMQGLSSNGGAGSGNGTSPGGGLAAGSDPATDHLFASSPVPAHFLHPGRPNSEHFLPFVSVPVLQHHHHQQQIAAAAAAAAHPQLQSPYQRQMGHFGSPPTNGQFEHHFLSRQAQQPVHRMGAPVHNAVPGYVEDLESVNGNGGRKVLTLFPTGED